MRNWLINIALFLTLHLFLFIADKTALVRLFEFGNFGHLILQTEWFTEWFTFYKTPFYNVILFISIIHILMIPIYTVVKEKLVWKKK